jgi:hypothetical protein
MPVGAEAAGADAALDAAHHAAVHGADDKNVNRASSANARLVRAQPETCWHAGQQAYFERVHLLPCSCSASRCSGVTVPSQSCTLYGRSKLTAAHIRVF